MTEPRHEGVRIEIGGREWIVAPLNIRLLRRYLPRIQSLGQAGADGITAEDIGTLVEVIHAAMARNYPGLALAEVEEMLDLASLGVVFAAVCGASGLTAQGTAKHIGADDAPGEGRAGDPAR